MSMAMLLFAVVLFFAAIATTIIVRVVIAEWREDRVVEAIEDDY